jgi:hypothetical protein
VVVVVDGSDTINVCRQKKKQSINNNTTIQQSNEYASVAHHTPTLSVRISVDEPIVFSNTNFTPELEPDNCNATHLRTRP